ncbi:RhoGAP-domain-containing protein [Trematosphaeria pertusa]|uniref:RhoGAP-domain-containing protein n=1 Tax=Trematosphaeria pertusa TaxID=390896 RepID=A0A6A6IPG9_9PLEO|nr:RhoGAP-domain-containing protein [Trematosphaeria pertusa]KAF2252137.1 RhoGAP-domain-containing protein [Trematosphaeria pertusa]
MPNGAHNHHGLSTPRVRNGEPQPAPAAEPASAQRDLKSWWKNFSKRNVKKEEDKEPEARGIFGVPLITSIPYANVAISLFNETGESYIYGYVPIVVAKCGVFLKEKATDVEGIFRLAGSEKRIKELKIAFDTPPRWGKGLDWSGYTVHDAANILRRYFNQLPEPIIPLQHYDAFREPLRGHQAEAVGQIEGQAPSVGGFDPDAAVRVYQRLIKELPSLNRQLLLYILDLLAVFAAKSDVNKMTTSNLAAIFQPGILSHPQHDMSPQDYRLSQDVLIFLIDNQDHFLIGQPAEESAQPAQRAQTFPAQMLDVGKPEPQPMADFVMPAVATPAMEIPGAFPLPSPGLVPPSSEVVTPAASAQAAQVLAPPMAHHPQRSPHVTPIRERSEFMEAPVDSGPAAEPTPAPRSFTQILSKVSPSSEEKQPGRRPNKLQKRRVPSDNPSAHSSTHSLTGAHAGLEGPPSPLPHPSIPQTHLTGSKEVLQAYNSDTISSRNSGATLKPSMSPSASFRSHSTATEYSEAEPIEEPPKEEPPKEEKKSFWRGGHRRGESKATPTASQTDLHGSVPGADKSMSSFGSGSGWGGGRRSLQYDSHQGSDLSVPYGGADAKEHGEKKSRLDWFKGKMGADKKARAKSPPGSTADLTSPQSLTKPKDDLAVRGRSMDIPRQTGEGSSDVTPTGTSQNPLATSPPSNSVSQPAAAPAPSKPNTAGDPPPNLSA